MEVSIFKPFPLPKKGLFLIILHADKIPPHLGLLLDNHFFSAKANHADVAIPFNFVKGIIDKKKIVTVIIEIQHALVTKELLVQQFSNYKNGLNTKQTCLTPILEIIQPNNKCATVHDLIASLTETHQITDYFGLHIPENFHTLPQYSQKEIQDRIQQIRDGKRK